MAISTSLKSLARATLFSSIGNQSTNKLNLGPLNEEHTTSILDFSFHNTPFQMVRYDIAVAFDPIAVAPKYAPTTHLDPSVFDRTLKLIVVDVAPWVRGIIAYETQLLQRRLKLSNLLSEGGKRKRMRNTRSALSALEGGERRMARREKHFGECLNMGHVMRTGGNAWAELVLSETMKSEAEDSAAPSSPMSDELSQ
ncbi:hypothetical protein PT974_04910 [Cladobotryum mycophilum]|uniref:Uncharacterized protein n=1 Tax=Cladobotryum mycophilum TaxID=491253 RepID=A0ABR0SQI1_9HYPO